MRKLMFIDTETGGLDPREHEITQIAGIVEIDGKCVEEFELRMRPDHPDKVSAEALQVTGQTLEQIMAHPLSQREGYLAMIGILGHHVDKFNRSDKFVWCGQNPRFDCDFVRALWVRMGDKYYGSWFWPNAVDLIGLAMAATMRGYLAGIPNMKLTSIAEAMGVPLDAHKAIEDVRATRECFWRLARLMPVKGEASEQRPANVQREGPSSTAEAVQRASGERVHQAHCRADQGWVCSCVKNAEIREGFI